jgi:hypothetical protein
LIAWKPKFYFAPLPTLHCLSFVAHFSSLETARGRDLTSFLYIYGYLLVPELFVEDNILFPLNGQGTFVENQLPTEVWFISNL